MIAGVPSETFAGERRVAISPGTVSALKKMGLDLLVEPGAGRQAGFTDEEYTQAGARMARDRKHLYQEASLILQINTFRSGSGEKAPDLDLVREGQTIIGLLNPLGSPGTARELARRGVTSFALELIPRISRAQSMDALSSMATIAGYKAALMGAATLGKLYPMMITAAGTITPAKVFVIGAGVAGLQAIATCNRLGAVVSGYDVRPAVREQVESVGGRFIELDLDTSEAEGSGGYARSMGEDFYRKQREEMARLAAEHDVVITTAAIPGKKSPLLITEAAVKGMKPGSVIVDLAAEGGGNCELTKPGETIESSGVSILGPLNLPATIPYHASQMYSRNIASFLKLLVKDGSLNLNLEDQIIAESLLTNKGEIASSRVREIPGSAASAVSAAV